MNLLFWYIKAWRLSIKVAGEEDIFISTNARLVKPTKFLLEFWKICWKNYYVCPIFRSEVIQSGFGCNRQGYCPVDGGKATRSIHKMFPIKVMSVYEWSPRTSEPLMEKTLLHKMCLWTFAVSCSPEIVKILKNKSRLYLKKICSLGNHNEISSSVRFRELRCLNSQHEKTAWDSAKDHDLQILNTYKENGTRK